MYFANPWGLLGLLSLPVIAAIHLYQRRFPPLLVAGAHLWGAETRVTTAGRRRDRLPITATLLLELLAGLIFSLALAQPRFGELDTVPHLVVVLDNSASMSASADGTSRFRDVALRRLNERIEELERDGRITLICSGTQPTLLGNRSMRWDEAQSALAQWQPRAPRHSFEAAWDEAARIVGAEGRFLFLTDRIPNDTVGLPRGMEVISVGRPLTNVALAAANWTFDSAQGEGRLFIRVANHGPDMTELSLSAESRGRTVLQQSLRVPGHGSIPVEAPLPGGLGELRIQINAPDDGLEVDNLVELVEPKIRLLTVATQFPSESIESRLVQRVLNASHDVQHAPSDTADLILGPAGTIPQLAAEQWWFGIGPINVSPVIRNQSRDLLGPFLIEKQHPLMDGVVLGGIVWGGVQPIDMDVRPLVSAGRTPLLGQLTSIPATGYVMNIDLARSNLGESPDWPILLTNLIEMRRDELRGLRLWNYRLNETIRFRAAASESDSTSGELQLEAPSGALRPLIRDRRNLVEITRLEDTGSYTIHDGDQVLDQFAVNFFDDDESTLTALAAGVRAPPTTVEASRLAIDDPYSWLMVLTLLILLAAIIADWYVLQPRLVATRSASR